MRQDTKRLSRHCISDVRLCVVGSCNVGKSAITVRFLTRRYIGEYQPNVEQTYRGRLDIGTDVIRYDLKDTIRAPDETFLTTWPTCVAVIYSIIDDKSFVYASKLLNDIVTFPRNPSSNNHTLPILAVIGNKKDLEHLRKVSEEDGKRLANKYNAMFLEASTSDDYNSIFIILSSLMAKSYQKEKNINSTNSSSSSSGKEKKTKVSPLYAEELRISLRRYSEPFVTVPRTITAPNIAPLRQRAESDDLITRTFEPIKNTFRRRKTLRENKSKYCTKVKDSHSPIARSLSLNNDSSIDNISHREINVEIKDTASTKSLPVIQSMPKSRSFTDMKTFLLFNNEKGSNMTSAHSTLSLHIRDKDKAFVDDIKETLANVSIPSISIPENKHNATKMQKEKKKYFNLPLKEDIYGTGHNDILKSADAVDKRNVGQRISNIFLSRDNSIGSYRQNVI